MTLNDYIMLNAGHERSDEFLRKFASTEVFFSIENPDENLKDGPLVTSSRAALKMQTVQLEVGCMALFYATKNNSKLSSRFGGLQLIKAAEMVIDLPNVDGMLVQSDSDAWFVADKQALRHVLGQVRASTGRN